MTDAQNLSARLESGLAVFDLTAYARPLARYLLLLEKWNKAYNLTAIRQIDDMIPLHIYDSLAIKDFLQGPSILDAGSGAGLPGIPLAITHPHLNFVLLDSNGKKVRFLQEVKRQLSLNNLQIVQKRVESYQPLQGFDTVISRAFSSLLQMVHWTKHLIKEQGIWLAMKGRYPEDELKELDLPYTVKSYTVSGIEAERCCVLINNKTKE